MVIQLYNCIYESIYMYITDFILRVFDCRWMKSILKWRKSLKLLQPSLSYNERTCKNLVNYLTFLFVITRYLFHYLLYNDWKTRTRSKHWVKTLHLEREIDWTSYNVTETINVELVIINVWIYICFASNLQLFHLYGCQIGDDG